MVRFEWDEMERKKRRNSEGTDGFLCFRLYCAKLTITANVEFV